MILTRGITFQRHILILGIIIIASIVRKMGGLSRMDAKEQACRLLESVSDMISSQAPHNSSVSDCSTLAAVFDSENY